MNPRKQILAALCVMVVLAIEAVFATSGWSQESPTWAAPPVVETTPEVAPSVAGDVAALKDVTLRKGPTWRQRRAMGITFRNIRRVLAEKKAAGELEGKDAATLSVEVANQLAGENPKAFADPSIDFDALLDFIERLIAFILRIMAIFALL